jgi:hypothetical protein
MYTIAARKQGFKPATVIVGEGVPKPIALALESEQPLNLAIIATLNQARNALSPETGSTVYRFTDKNIDQLPQGDNTPLNDVLIQAPGVAQDSYGQGQSQIHIHGLNGGGIQYRLNGVFLPEAVSSFGQLFSAYFIKSMSLIDNFMPAQFGYRNEGVIDTHSKDGCMSPGGQFELLRRTARHDSAEPAIRRMCRESELLSQRILLSKCTWRTVGDADADAGARSHQPRSGLQLLVISAESCNPAQFNHGHRDRRLSDSGSTRFASGVPNQRGLQLSELG